MIKVGFWFDAPADYSGGINYIRNILYALSLVNDGSVRPYIFFSADMPDKIVNKFSPYATVVRTKLLQRGTLPWLFQKIIYKLFGSMALVNMLLKSRSINILSHVWFVYKGIPSFRIISWIPDFQYLHLPELFPTLDTDEETKRNQEIISQSDTVILSSHNALEDFKKIAGPEYQSRGEVLQFVSQPDNNSSSLLVSRDILEQKYGYQGSYFFLPNQFWAHKNHMVVLEAVKKLKENGTNILVLCTGNMNDLRIKNTKYIDGIYDFIATNNLQDHVKILGQIDYDDVLSMMKNALAVINPSRFEGWSSSVEEAKSMGKPVILSNLDVHIEQNPKNGHYFDPDDALGLSKILADVWDSPSDESQEDAEAAARHMLEKRTIEFGNAYLAILNNVATHSKKSMGTVPTRSGA